MPAETAADREPLSKLLYKGTTAAHQAAEQTPYVLAMFQGKLSKGDYSRWLVRFHFVYSALERRRRRCATTPPSAGFTFPSCTVPRRSSATSPTSAGRTGGRS